ncbi:MAG: hypothetical protein WCR52_04185 [Bacteroidota bacterium]
MKISYRRKLPHKFYPGYTFFITWNLKGAIPKTVIDRLTAERDEALLRLAADKNMSPQEQLEMALLIKRKFFFQYNDHLDQVHSESPLWLKNPEVAEVVANRLVMKLINGATAVQANRILGRSGKFWAEGYFDRYIRDEKHLFDSINYTLYNPVKAGICKDWRDYQFSYLANGFDCY